MKRTQTHIMTNTTYTMTSQIGTQTHTTTLTKTNLHNGIHNDAHNKKQIKTNNISLKNTHIAIHTLTRNDTQTQ